MQNDLEVLEVFHKKYPIWFMATWMVDISNTDQSMLASIESFTDLVSLISDIWLFCIYNVYIIVIRCRC